MILFLLVLILLFSATPIYAQTVILENFETGSLRVADTGSSILLFGQYEGEGGCGDRVCRNRSQTFAANGVLHAQIVGTTLMYFLLLLLILWPSLVCGQSFLTWSDQSTNELNFEIERQRPPDPTFTLIGTTGIDIASYLDATGLVLDCYRVRAVNEAGSSGYSNTACRRMSAHRFIGTTCQGCSSH